MNDYKFKKGMRVIEYLNCAGYTTTTEYTILSATKKGVYLDNGAGNDPTGPFDKVTGAHADNNMGFGTKYIKPVGWVEPERELTYHDKDKKDWTDDDWDQWEQDNEEDME